MSLSCEIPSETMPLCIHGVWIKIPCDKCKFEHRINLLESQLKALTEMYKDLSCKVAGFSDHRIRQIDENSKISRRIDELEKYKSLIDHLNNNHNDWREPLMKNEHLIEHVQDGIEKCFDRIEEVERNLRAIRDSYNNLCAPSLRKEPYKCPVCDGKCKCSKCNGKGEYFTGNRYGQTAICEFCKGNPECNICEGKGIIWG